MKRKNIRNFKYVVIQLGGPLEYRQSFDCIYKGNACHISMATNDEGYAQRFARSTQKLYDKKLLNTKIKGFKFKAVEAKLVKDKEK